jgi:hypothetical protein
MAACFASRSSGQSGFRLAFADQAGGGSDPVDTVIEMIARAATIFGLEETT